MADDDDNGLDRSRAQIANAAFDYRAITKRKQWLKRAHAARPPSGEDNSGDVSHVKKLTTKSPRHKESVERTLRLRVFVVIRLLALPKLVMHTPASSVYASSLQSRCCPAAGL